MRKHADADHPRSSICSAIRTAEDDPADVIYALAHGRGPPCVDKSLSPPRGLQAAYRSCFIKNLACAGQPSDLSRCWRPN